jgi:hypothetical protein
MNNNFGVNIENDGYTHEQRIAISQMQDKMIMNYLNGNAFTELFEMKQQVNELHTLVTKKPLPVEEVLNKKEKMKLEIEEIRNKRKLNALLEKN